MAYREVARSLGRALPAPGGQERDGQQDGQGEGAAHGHGTVPDYFGGLGMQSLSR